MGAAERARDIEVIRNIAVASDLGPLDDEGLRAVEQRVIQEKQGLTYEQAARLLNTLGLTHVDLAFARDKIRVLCGEYGEEEARKMRERLKASRVTPSGCAQPK